jgi:hypothetical protein
MGIIIGADNRQTVKRAHARSRTTDWSEVMTHGWRQHSVCARAYSQVLPTHLCTMCVRAVCVDRCWFMCKNLTLHARRVANVCTFPSELQTIQHRTCVRAHACVYLCSHPLDKHRRCTTVKTGCRPTNKLALTGDGGQLLLLLATVVRRHVCP